MNKVASAYAQIEKETDVNGSSPVELVIMLYNGAISEIKKAAKFAAMSEDKALGRDERTLAIQEKAKAVDKAMMIISNGLMGSLDMQKGMEIAENLMQVYISITSILLRASIKNDQEEFAKCAKSLEDLLEGFTSILENGIPDSPKEAKGAV